MNNKCICTICFYCFLITIANSLHYVNIPRASSSWSPPPKYIIGYYLRVGGIIRCGCRRQKTSRWMKRSTRTAKNEIRAKVAGSCLTAAVYFIHISNQRANTSCKRIYNLLYRSIATDVIRRARDDIRHVVGVPRVFPQYKIVPTSFRKRAR